ncbi:uncharacterized protein [Cicer arietinum]|uniref:Receptor-like protein Cf-9 homolog n=1 Tax=Cicer arietinum TaxID=3827 RepID=A0A1S2Z5H0_CICAR|nr:receptor-like protein Cf-9 homolog [Cicer arietinum]
MHLSSKIKSSMELLLLCLNLLLFHFPFSSSFNFLYHHEERIALLQFKSSLTTMDMDSYYYSCDEPLQKTTTWKNNTNCCSWHGVTCDTSSGYVIHLNLGCEGLKGVIHPNNTIFRLTHLQTLNISYNDFSNSYFHSKFSGFMSLTHLDLSNSYFRGEISPQISHLSKLTSLRLSENYELVWKETTLKRFVQNATNLRELFLYGTDMSTIRTNSIDLIFNQSSSLVTLNLGSTKLIGNFKNNILCLPGIQELDMSSNNGLETQLPEFSCSISLKILDLSECQFQGTIPLSFSNLTHLTSISLFNNLLNGSIPPPLLTLPPLTFLYLYNNKLSGQIPNVFPLSNKFQELFLRNNKIGGELPTSLSNLQHLIRFDLSYNSFSGQIPNVFSGMAKLQELNLGSNNLQGQIPSSLFNLTQLDTLDCSFNKLEGPLPKKITGFQKLIELTLENNLIHGTIPSWCLSLFSMVNLDLSNNRLTGHISAISSHSLEVLYLWGNKLQGNIPESIFNLANLTQLFLSSNNFSGFVNFQLFSNLQNLEYLYLSDNSQLSLNFESNFNFSRLRELGLSSLSLTGIPKLSGKLSNLSYLDLSNNKLNGTVPNWLLETSTSLNLSQNLFTSIDHFSKKLDSIDLSFNLLAGDLSFLSDCNMSSLRILNLANNNLTGTIPQCLANLSSLLILDLQMNNFLGTLPNNFSKDCSLETLNLNDNQLEGHLPISLSNCKNLEVLNLGNNKIQDYFPYWLQTIDVLKVLILKDNKFHGSIANLNINNPFPNLIIFYIAGNNFSGMLPKDLFKNFVAMRSYNGRFHYMSILLGGIDRPISQLSMYYDYVSLATKGIQLKFVKIPTIFVSIDLSRNKFEGEIPNVIGELHGLIGLNLSHNRLTGPIPQSIANLKNLESLDLSSNRLSGVIPLELTNLIYLGTMNLSNNHLVGEIPKGKQFDTFSNGFYEGNLGLCGFPLTMKCGPEKKSSLSSKFWSEDKFGFGWEPVAIGYGCGVVFGIGLGSCMFLMGRPRWLVVLFGGYPKRRVKRRTRVRSTHASTMNQMIQMS